MNETRQSTELLHSYEMPDRDAVRALLAAEVNAYKGKIVVLDDDPTGVQTVHDIAVYTDWSMESIRAGFDEPEKMFFILTNSRGFTQHRTEEVHREIAENVAQVAGERRLPYLMVSRSDSTLRGHYPLETEVLRQVSEEHGTPIDGEILCPYFKEGGRFTIGNIHYVRYGDELVPAAQTEFARDETFGYHHSHLGDYVAEKTDGAYRAEDCTYISLEELRSLSLDQITAQLLQVHDFGKIIVNAIDQVDVEILAIALYRAMRQGRHFLLRSAAALVKALGNVSDQPLLGREDMVVGNSGHGGIIVVGSHTAKTTAQLERLKAIESITFIEMDSDLVLQPERLEQEVDRILEEERSLIEAGVTVCVSTKRRLLKVENDTPEQALLRSVRISEALQRCVGDLNASPAYIVAKGGITSSDVGTKALHVRRALVLGQIQPGVPVWQTGPESRFPGIPYIIFPGNVGDEDTLYKAVSVLQGA